MFRKSYSFAEQLAISAEYEEKMLKHWSDSCFEVIDVRDDKRHRKMDIDFVHLRLERQSLKARTLELKVDFRLHKTGNVFIEPEGWLKKTRAETIAYLDAVNKICYYIKTSKLRSKKVFQSIEEFRTVSVKTKDFGGYETLGILIPIEWIVRELKPKIENLTNIL